MERRARKYLDGIRNPRARQLLAYLAVAAAGSASLGTSACHEQYAEETPGSLVELGAEGSVTTLRFRVRTNLALQSMNLGLNWVSGEGAASVVVSPKAADGSITDGAATFTVDASAPQDVKLCEAGCAAREVEVAVTREQGTDTASLDVRLSASSIDYVDCANRDYVLVLERVE